MTDPRAIEHLETAARQDNPGRRLALVGMALSLDPKSPAGPALAALTLQDLPRAAALLQSVHDRQAKPGSMSGASPCLRAVVSMALAARDFSGGDPHAAAERMGPLLRLDLPKPLAVAAVRLVMASAAAVGDVELLCLGIAAARGHGEALKREVGWFAYILAKRIGKPEAGSLLEAADAAMPSLRDYLDDGVGGKTPGNPGAIPDGQVDDPVVMAAVLPGLFQAGALPARKPLRRAA